jgi:transposase-like protein
MGEKRDGRARRITAARRRTELVKAYHASGMTMAAFARREGVKYPTFVHWVMKAAKASHRGLPVCAKAKGPPAASAALTPRTGSAQIQALAPVRAQPVQTEARLPDGTVLRGNNPAELAALIRALRS